MGIGSQVVRWAPPPGRCRSVFAAIPSGPLDYGFVALVVPVRPASWPAGGSCVKARTTSTSGCPSRSRPLVHGHRLHPGCSACSSALRWGCWRPDWPGWPAVCRTRAPHRHRTRPPVDGTVAGRGSGDRRRDRLRGRAVAGTPAQRRRTGTGPLIPVAGRVFRLQEGRGSARPSWTRQEESARSARAGGGMPGTRGPGRKTPPKPGRPAA